MKKTNQEIEVRFLEIEEKELKQRLKEKGAIDLGEEILEEIIFYNKEKEWQTEFVRLRKQKGEIILCYKNHNKEGVAEEIELTINDWNNAKIFLERIGLVAAREQEKKRHSFMLNNVLFDFDTWPNVPCYLEIEGSYEEEVREAAKSLGLDWRIAIFEDAKKVLEKHYNIPVSSLKVYKFEKRE